MQRFLCRPAREASAEPDRGRTSAIFWTVRTGRAGCRLLQGAASGEARGECSFRRGASGVFPAAVILSALPTKSIRLELVDLTATRDCESILEAKKQLEKSEERLRLAVEATGIGVIDTHFSASGADKVVEWTREARAAFGLADDVALCDEVIFDRIFPADRDLVRDAIAHSLDPGGDGLFKVEHRVVRPDGEIRWISSRGQTTFGGEPPARAQRGDRDGRDRAGKSGRGSRAESLRLAA